MSDFFEKCLEELSKCERVIDVGGGKPFQKDMAKYEEWFKDCEYLTVDQGAYNPSVVGDVHDLPIENESADGAICKAVLEHVHDPFKVVGEILRILRKGGKVLAWIPFVYPYHGNPNYKDYYRFTRDGVEYLFRDFKDVEIIASKGYFQSILELLPVFRRVSFLGGVLDRVIKIENCQSGFWIFAKK